MYSNIYFTIQCELEIDDVEKCHFFNYNED